MEPLRHRKLQAAATFKPKTLVPLLKINFSSKQDCTNSQEGGWYSKSGNIKSGKKKEKTHLEAVHGCTPQDAGVDRRVGGHINLSMLIISRGEYHITASSNKSTKVAV